MIQTANNLFCYPTPILKAIQNIHLFKEFKSFSSSTREVLVAIATRLDYRDPERPFWFKRENAAQNTGLSRRTIYYSLDKLEKAGFIIRSAQPVSVEGYYCCSQIKATETLIKLLGLFQSPPPRPCAKNAPSHIYHIDNLKKQPTERNSFSEIEQTREEEENKQATLFHRDPHLKRLLDSGLSKYAIFALMAQSKSVGQRLSNIIAYLGETLNKINNPRGIFAYLRTCIKSGRDFTQSLNKKNLKEQEEVDKQAQRDQLSQNLSEFKNKYSGQVFKSIKTGDSYLIDNNGALNQNTGGWLTLYDLFQAVSNGKLVPQNI